MADDMRRRAMLKLSLAPNVGPLMFTRLVEAFGDPERIFEANTSELTRVEQVGPKIARGILSVSEGQVDAELEAAEKRNVHIVACGEEAYPKALRHIIDPPLVLYVRGELAEEDALAIGMVGSRRPTFYGRKQSRRIASGLASYGFTVVSGMARGIDTEAHEGALSAGGRTIAVLGTGLGVIYPSENAELYMRIVESGAVISEFPMMFPVSAGNFPRRNRIISGLSLGVVVVEAGGRSGALITARHAMEQNRDVFAVPGQVDNVLALGCHRLLRDGATLVTGPVDVVEQLGPLAEAARTADIDNVVRPQALRLNDREKNVYASVDGSSVSLDALLEATGLAVPELQSALTVLEMRKLIRRLPGQVFART